MKKGKKFLVGVVITIGIFMVLKWVNDPERKIFAMVQKNQTAYAVAAEAVLKGEEKPDIENVSQIHLRVGEHVIVDFFVSGFGIAPASTYYGFYYSPEDLVLPYLEERAVLTEYEKDAWSWQGSGDNKGVTKKIADCWYYYEASF